MKRTMLKEERFLRDSIIEECGGMPLDIRRQLIAFEKAVQEDICIQVADAIKIFPKRTQVKLMNAIMQYEKPNAIRERGK